MTQHIPVRAVVFDIGNVLSEGRPERLTERVGGEALRRAAFDSFGLPAMNDRVDRGEGFAAAEARGWPTDLFEHPEGWATRLMAGWLLTEEEAA
jgi:hypothetical protein